MPPPRSTLSPVGAMIGGCLFALAILGWLWLAPLIAVGAGWHPQPEAGRQVAQASRR